MVSGLVCERTRSVGLRMALLGEAPRAGKEKPPPDEALLHRIAVLPEGRRVPGCLPGLRVGLSG